MKILARQLRRRGFTLIELLVVIAIIGTLATIMIPSIGKAKENARRLSARNDATQLQTAIANFYSEYGKYPVTSSGDGPYKTDGQLMDVLMGSDEGEADQLNPKNINYFDNPKIAKSPKEQGWVESLKVLNDPWGNPYEIYLDGDDDGEMMVPGPYQGQGKGKFGTGQIKKKIMVCSAGKDGKHETTEDNVTSWD